MGVHYTFDQNFYKKVLGDRDYLNNFPTYDTETTDEWQISTVLIEITQDLLGGTTKYVRKPDTFTLDTLI